MERLFHIGSPPRCRDVVCTAISIHIARQRLLDLGIHDLDSPVLGGEGIGRILELGLAVADGNQRIRRQPELLDQNAFHGLGTALGQILIEISATYGVGMTVDEKHGPVHLLVG